MKDYTKIVKEQKTLCEKYEAGWFEASPELKIGISKNLDGGIMPINGLRHRPENGTAGWYIWAGEYSDDPNFFDSIHIDHLEEKFPLVLKYLGLPPGWRFQIDNQGYEDVWKDQNLK